MAVRIVLCWVLWCMAISASGCNPWTYVTGNCIVDEKGCALSPNYPSLYNNNARCSFGVSNTCARPLQVWQFNLEASNSGSCTSDAVTVNGRRYCGSSGPSGVTPSGSISFSSDSSIGGNGFKLCMVENNGLNGVTSRPAPTTAMQNYRVSFATSSFIGPETILIGLVPPFLVCAGTMMCMIFCRGGPAGWRWMSGSLCWALVSHSLVLMSLLAPSMSTENVTSYENYNEELLWGCMMVMQGVALVALFLFFMSVCMSTMWGFCCKACNYNCTSRCSGILIIFTFVVSAAALTFEITLIARAHGRPAMGTYLASGSVVAVGVLVFFLFRTAKKSVQSVTPAEAQQQPCDQRADVLAQEQQPAGQVFCEQLASIPTAASAVERAAEPVVEPPPLSPAPTGSEQKCSLFAAACLVVVPVLFMVALTLPYSTIKYGTSLKVPINVGWLRSGWYISVLAFQTLATEIAVLVMVFYLSSVAVIVAMLQGPSLLCFNEICGMFDHLMKYGASPHSLLVLVIVCVLGFIFDKPKIPKDNNIITEVETYSVMPDSGFYLMVCAMCLSVVSQYMWSRGKLRAVEVFTAFATVLVPTTRPTAGLQTLSGVQPNTIAAAANLNTDDPEKGSSVIYAEPALGQF